MGILDGLLGVANDVAGIIASGKNKKTGGHDHRTNSGDDRTPAQKKGDQKRRK